MGSPLQNPLTEILFYVKHPFKRDVIIDLRDLLKESKPAKFSFTKDPFMADVIMQPIFSAVNVSDYTDGAVIFQFGLNGETIDFWQYIWSKAKFVVSTFELPYSGYNYLHTENFEDIWRYIH